MDMIIGKPLKGRKLAQTKEFLSSLNLGWEENVETTIIMMENGAVVATASRENNVLKCIGVSPEYQSEGLSATMMTELVKDAYSHGHSHLFLFTKPINTQLFSDLGFYEIAGAKDAVLMENKRTGITDFVEAIPKKNEVESAACIVANCNPFTNGHLYLIEEAASSCDFLYLFILSENRSEFSASDRLMLAKQGTAHIKNILVHPTGCYMVSAATFPQYFLKNRANAGKISCELDLSIFAKYFAPTLNIGRRFVGNEPFDLVTAAYNEQMKQFLPPLGVSVVELPRKEAGGAAISASKVRALMKRGELEELKALVPDSTFQFLKGKDYGFFN